MTWRNTAADAARVQVLDGPPWLLAPLFVRSTLPTELLPEWRRWWSAAVAFRPGGAAPRQEDLVAFSAELTKRWRAARPDFDSWLDRQPVDVSVPLEQRRLDTFQARTGRHPAPRTLTVVVVPFGDELFQRPEPDRLVVDAALRSSGARYLAQLDPVLADFF